jgi:ubiquinone/menaquinone biosynthesis C-methylase UbiE
MAASTWDEMAETYNEIFSKDSYYMDIITRIGAEVEPGEDQKIMDLGCGTGNLTAHLLEKCPNAKIYGVDPSMNMIEVCASRFGKEPRVNISLGDGTRVDFLSEHFDYAVSNIALHHVLPELRPRCAGEIWRVLKPNGVLVYSDIFTDVGGEAADEARCRDVVEKMIAYALHNLDIGAYEKMIFLLEQIPKHIRQDGEYMTSVDEWLGDLQQAGFQNLEVIHMPHPEFGYRIIRGTKAP